MKLGGGRKKGNAFERFVAKMVISAGNNAGLLLDGKDVYRAPLSGGHIFAKVKDPGDLVISDRLRKHFPVSIECKHYRSVGLEGFFTKNGKLFDWLNQSINSSGAHSPIVVFKWNASKVFCIFPSDAFTLKSKLTYTRFFWRKRYWRVSLFSDLLASVFTPKNGAYK